MTQVKIPKFKLNDGREIPALGCGTWLGFDEKFELIVSDAPKLVDALSYAIDIGYRHIDGAHFSRMEPEIGRVVNQKIRDGVVKREDMFLTTKVWNNNHRETDVEVSVRDSLRRLNLDYVDLLMIHFPISISVEGEDEKIDYLETWRGMETALKKGFTKSIGVSNFNVEQLKRLLQNCKVPPVCIQVEINLNLGQDDLVSFCHANKIVVIGFSPFGTMIPIKAKPDTPEPKLDNPTLIAIARKHGKTVPQVTLRYLYQRGIATIPKSLTKSRILENASIFDFSLDESDVLAIRAFDNCFRTVRPSCWESYSNYPFEKTGEKMDMPVTLLKWKNGANLDID